MIIIIILMIMIMILIIITLIINMELATEALVSLFRKSSKFGSICSGTTARPRLAR